MSVTTHTGGVDWNNQNKESVANAFGHHPHGWCGLKFVILDIQVQYRRSPPTRVVWIEIFTVTNADNTKIVTTHTGGVDWNESPTLRQKPLYYVTTHTGGVDWNRFCWFCFCCDFGHHPHGWCGLKFEIKKLELNIKKSPPTRVVWIEITPQNIDDIQSICHHPHGWCGLKSMGG